VLGIHPARLVLDVNHPLANIVIGCKANSFSAIVKISTVHAGLLIILRYSTDIKAYI
jgi:hypothetical protein